MGCQYSVLWSWHCWCCLVCCLPYLSLFWTSILCAQSYMSDFCLFVFSLADNLVCPVHGCLIIYVLEDDLIQNSDIDLCAWLFGIPWPRYSHSPKGCTTGGVSKMDSLSSHSSSIMNLMLVSILFRCWWNSSTNNNPIWVNVTGVVSSTYPSQTDGRFETDVGTPEEGQWWPPKWIFFCSQGLRGTCNPRLPLHPTLGVVSGMVSSMGQREAGLQPNEVDWFNAF